GPGRTEGRRATTAGHAAGRPPAETDWWQILQLYNQLAALTPGAVVALNRAVAVAEVEGPDAALALVDGLDLDGYHLLHAIRADLLRRLDRRSGAAAADEGGDARAGEQGPRALPRPGLPAAARRGGAPAPPG